MIASVFSKSTPINYFLIIGLMVLCVVFYQYDTLITIDFVSKIMNRAPILLILVFSMFAIDFILIKNSISRNSSYSFLFFFVFLLFIPTVFNNINIVISSYFILLAIRRLISMQSLKMPKEKIFDASLWIFVASFFHFWSILFIILVFLSIIFHVAEDYKNWLLPFIAFITVVILFILYSLVFDKQVYYYVLDKTTISLDFHYFKNSTENLSFSLFVAFSLFLLFSILSTFSQRPSHLKVSYKKIIYSFFIGFLIFIISPNKSNDILIFCILPLAMIATSYLENIKDSLWKEIFTTAIVLSGILLFIFQL